MNAILISGLCALSTHLAIDKRLLTTLFQFPTSYLTLLSTSLQTVILCLILYLLVIYVVSIHCLGMT